MECSSKILDEEQNSEQIWYINIYQSLSSDFSGFWSLTFSTRELPRRIRAKGGPRPVLGVEPQLETGERVGESLGEEA